MGVSLFVEVVIDAFGDGIINSTSFILVKAPIVGAEFVFFDAVLFHQTQLANVLEA